MSTSSFRLESVWHAETADSGYFEFTLFNVGTTPLEDFRLVYSSLTRAVPEHECVNAALLKRDANYHEYGPLAGMQIEPGGNWRFELRGVTRTPTHRTDGPKSAYIVLADNTTLPVDCGDLLLAGASSTGVLKSVPEGSVLEPYAITPWPRSLALSGKRPVPALIYADASSVAADKTPVMEYIMGPSRSLQNEDGKQ